MVMTYNKIESYESINIENVFINQLAFLELNPFIFLLCVIDYVFLQVKELRGNIEERVRNLYYKALFQ